MIRFTSLLVLGVVLLAGCNADPAAEVSGTVLLGKEPLKEGDIIFEEADGSKTPAATKIVDGKYSLKVLPGAKKVRILASRPASKVDPVMGAAAKESLLGPEFNDKTKLTAEIKPGANPGVDFTVTPLPPGK